MPHKRSILFKRGIVLVIRVNKTKDFTTISNYHFRDKRLTLKAKGLLSQMLTLSDDWNYSVAGLVAINKENETAIKSALAELKQCGYLVITKKMPNETDSKHIEYLYDIYEQPVENQEIENQEVDFLHLENLPVENQGQYNTNNKKLNNKIQKNKDTKDITYMFDEFWEAYPKKVGKKAAQKAFAKVREKDLHLLIPALEKQKLSKQWSKDNGRYIPNASTWLNGERWNDELQPGNLDFMDFV